MHFADWQATTDGRELLNPVYAQYRETIVVVEIERPDGTLSLFNFCPFIWVDQDISLVRGYLQGWPKKLGSTYAYQCEFLSARSSWNTRYASCNSFNLVNLVRRN
jgi:hypothetical protein